MKAKSKISSTIEILVSTILFVTIIFVGARGLLSMNGNNKKAQAFTLSANCSDQIKNKIVNSIAQADSSSPVYGIKTTSAGYVAEEINKLPGKRGDFNGVGFIVKGQPFDSLVVIVKKPQKNQYDYSYLSVILKDGSSLSQKSFINDIMKSEELKNIGECHAMKELNAVSLENPFQISFVESYKGKDNSKSVYEIKLDDFIYSKNDLLTYSNLFILENKIYD